MVVANIFSHLVGLEIIEESKALHRLCGQRGALDSKRANKCPLILFFRTGRLYIINNGEGEIHFQYTKAGTGLYGTYF